MTTKKQILKRLNNNTDLIKKDEKRKKLVKCWQCKQYTVSTYKNEFGGYSESCSNNCGPRGLFKMLNFGGVK